MQKPIITSNPQPHPQKQQQEGHAPPYREDLLSLHRSLVEIESITGNENAVGNLLAQHLEARGYLIKRQPIPVRTSTPPSGGGLGGERFNLIARPKSSGTSPNWRPRLVVTSHIDTVPPFIPYSIDATSPEDVSPETVIRGRGSVDAKASVAAQIIALGELLSGGAVAPEDVMLLYVVGEETNGDGMRHFSKSLRVPGLPSMDVDAVIFGEPTENKLVCGHKGHMACTVTAKGKAGHSGYPWLGKSANELLMRALLRIVDADLGSSDMFGNTTVNVGVLRGGVAANVIPESATAEIAVRVAIGPQFSAHNIIKARIDDILRDLDPDSLRMSCDNGYGVVQCNCDVEGFETITVNYGTDVPNLAGNHTRYLFGPGYILVAHSDHEALTVSDLEVAVEGYKRLIKHALSI